MHTHTHGESKTRSTLVKRSQILCGMSLVLFAGMMGRLAYLQLYRHDHYVQEAKRIRGGKIEIAARRGGIMDRNGIYLVHDQLAYMVTMDPNAWYAGVPAKDKEKVAAERKHLCLTAIRRWMPEAEVDAVLQKRPLRRGKKNPKRLITYDLGKVSPKVATAFRKAHVPGIGLLESSRRTALDGTLAPHVVGFTNSNGLGMEALEMRLNKVLGGSDGVRVAEFDNGSSLSRVHKPIPWTVQVDKPVEDGKDVVLTIDSRIQRRTQQILGDTCQTYKAESGSAVVLDPRSGEIVAMASWPTFNVNAFGDVSKEARRNRAVAETFEPGSTLKAVTVAAALESGVVNPARHFYCTGALKIGKNTIHCASHNGSSAHGDESVLDVIRTSCNVATAQCAFLLQKPRLYEYMNRFGLTSRTGSGLPGEQQGLLSKPSTWSQVKLANVGFGQGIAVTPLQLAGAFSVFGDGVWRQPHIVKGYKKPESDKLVTPDKRSERRVVSPETARQMRNMLSAVIERGTGRKARLDGYTAGGKTGTAQVAEHGRYGGKFVSSFAGMAPLSDPQLVVVVAIRDPKGQHYGGEVAAPAFRQIAEESLLLMRAPRDRQTLAPARGGSEKEGPVSYAE